MNTCAQAEFPRFFSFFDSKPSGAHLFLTKPVNEQEPHQDRDIKLMRQIAAGDRAAFGEFYDRHSMLMFSVASKSLNGADEAEDVLQEVFAQIWEKAGRFDPKLGKTSSWAAILVRNKAIERELEEY
jgi:RNA polymerase sigma-70 factor (ECF subfamily)